MLILFSSIIIVSQDISVVGSLTDCQSQAPVPNLDCVSVVQCKHYLSYSKNGITCMGNLVNGKIDYTRKAGHEQGI